MATLFSARRRATTLTAGAANAMCSNRLIRSIEDLLDAV
jgi:hypothetical protein